MYFIVINETFSDKIMCVAATSTKRERESSKLKYQKLK